MREDFKNVFSLPYFKIVFFVYATLKFFILFLLPTIPSKLAPDEGTYASLVSYVAKGLPVSNYPDYGPALYNTTKSFTLPSSALTYLGFSELTAVRAVSSLYGVASLVALGLCYFSILRLMNLDQSQKGIVFTFGQYFVFGIWVLLPSNFLWSTVGLRESAVQFWLFSCIYFLSKIVGSLTTKISPIALFSLLVSQVFFFGARRETAFLWTILSLLCCALIVRRRVDLLAPICLLIGLIIGQAFVTTPTYISSQQQSVVTDEIATNLNPNNLTASKETNVKRDVVANNLTASKETNVKRDVVANIRQQLKGPVELGEQREKNRKDAKSALPPSKCNLENRDLVYSFLCNLSELPLRLISFLFQPLPFLDTGSQSLTLAGIENIFWIFLFCTNLYLLVKNFRLGKLKIFSQAQFYLIAFVFLYSSAAALYEGNLGTAFRHKSTILGPLILSSLLSLRVFVSTVRNIK